MNKCLPDIPRGPTWSRDHLHECEVIHVASWTDADGATDYDRMQKHFAAVLERRGAEAANRLRDDVRAELRMRHQQKMPEKAH